MALTLPNIPNVSSLIQSRANLPNVNAATAGVTAAVDQLKSQISSLVSGSAGAITGAIGSLQSQVTSALSNLPSPVTDLQSEIARALPSLAGGRDVFLSQMQRIENLFPEVDVQSILNRMGSGSFNFSVDVPNIELNSLGETIQRAIPNVPSLELPEALPELPELPEITVPEILPPIQVPDLTTTLAKLPVLPNGGIDFSKASDLAGIGEQIKGAAPEVQFAKSRLASFLGESA